MASVMYYGECAGLSGVFDAIDDRGHWRQPLRFSLHQAGFEVKNSDV